MLTLAVLAFAFTAYAIVPQAIPIYTISDNVLRELYVADGVVAASSRWRLFCWGAPSSRTAC